MALGVLNNLSAIYAENNLNNTNSSLQTVLQQLSSGSKINSGADDAAGLSLVNGLAANSAALTQSETNATEGVGLLQVADGALSQVTSLLNRAITLATEASNGTLNSTQESAANQEYSRFLPKSTTLDRRRPTTSEQVFAGITMAIYTGDSSTTGSSIDDLNIRTLSEAQRGRHRRRHVLQQRPEQHVPRSFICRNSWRGWAMLLQAPKQLRWTFWQTGTDGSSSIVSHTIPVPAGDNTVQGLITAINDSGLGLSASFTTAGAAGVINRRVVQATQALRSQGGRSVRGVTQSSRWSQRGPRRNPDMQNWKQAATHSRLAQSTSNRPMAQCSISRPWRARVLTTFAQRSGEGRGDSNSGSRHPNHHVYRGEPQYIRRRCTNSVRLARRDDLQRYLFSPPECSDWGRTTTRAWAATLYGRSERPGWRGDDQLLRWRGRGH